jgi:Fe-S cluster biogenesis protein NfuA
MPDSENLRAVGDRIDQLLAELRSATADRVWEGVEEVLRLLTELYGGALERVMELSDPAQLDRLVADDLIASLLIVHGLHPVPVNDRVHRALEGVRPFLGQHGGDVELLGVEDDRVQLRMLGSCNGCPSSSITLKMAVEKAILEAAPEIEGIDVADDELAGLTTPVHLGPKPSFDPLDCPAGTAAS